MDGAFEDLPHERRVAEGDPCVAAEILDCEELAIDIAEEHGGAFDIQRTRLAGSELADQPDAYLFQTITSGLGRMPSFRNTLSEDQILEVAEYLRVEQGSS